MVDGTGSVLRRYTHKQHFGRDKILQKRQHNPHCLRTFLSPLTTTIHFPNLHPLKRNPQQHHNLTVIIIIPPEPLVVGLVNVADLLVWAVVLLAVLGDLLLGEAGLFLASGVGDEWTDGGEVLWGVGHWGWEVGGGMVWGMVGCNRVQFG